MEAWAVVRADGRKFGHHVIGLHVLKLLIRNNDSSLAAIWDRKRQPRYAGRMHIGLFYEDGALSRDTSDICN